MSEVTTYSQPSTEGAFNARTMIVVAAVGTLAFLAMLVLGAYAPDLRSGRNGGTHALSNAATGFSGLVRLAQDTGRNPVIVRTEPDLKNEDLAVITPDHGTGPWQHPFHPRPARDAHSVAQMANDSGSPEARLGTLARIAPASRSGAHALSDQPPEDRARQGP